PARRDLPGLPGVRIRARVQGPEPEAVVGHLRLDLLHADRLPRLPRDRGRDHAVGGAVPDHQGPLYARPALRIRGGRVVLALRRRRLAGPVRRRLLVVVASPGHGAPGCAPDGDGSRGFPFGSARLAQMPGRDGTPAWPPARAARRTVTRRRAALGGSWL